MNATEEKFSDNISTASEASETAGSGKHIFLEVYSGSVLKGVYFVRECTWWSFGIRFPFRGVSFE